MDFQDIHKHNKELLKSYCSDNEEMLLELIELYTENHNIMNELARIYSKRFSEDHINLKFFALKLLFMYEALKNAESEVKKKRWDNIKTTDRKGQELIVDYIFNPNTKRVISTIEYVINPKTKEIVGKTNSEFVYMKNFLNVVLDRESKDSIYYKAAKLLRKYFYFSIREGDFHIYKDLIKDNNGVVKLKGMLTLKTAHIDYNLSSVALIACNRFVTKEEQEATTLKPIPLSDVALRYMFCRTDSQFTLDSIGYCEHDSLVRTLDKEVKDFFDYLNYKKEQLIKDWKWFRNELKQCLLMYSNVF